MNFCGTIVRTEEHKKFISFKEDQLGRKLTFEELWAADAEWTKIKKSESGPCIYTPFVKSINNLDKKV